MTDPLPFPTPRFGPPIDEPAGPAEITPSLIDMARAIASICATRILLLLAVIISAPIWCYTVYDPTTLRIAAETCFAIVSMMPLVFLYIKKG